MEEEICFADSRFGIAHTSVRSGIGHTSVQRGGWHWLRDLTRLPVTRTRATIIGMGNFKAYWSCHCEGFSLARLTLPTLTTAHLLPSVCSVFRSCSAVSRVGAPLGDTSLMAWYWACPVSWSSSRAGDSKQFNHLSTNLPNELILIGLVLLNLN